MPAWNEILTETKGIGSPNDVIRRKYLKKLADYTGRNIIIYYSGWLQKPGLLRDQNFQLHIVDADKAGFMSVINGMDRSRGLDLILHTPGGDMAATESLVDYLRAMFGTNIRAFVPQIAMSAGTIIAFASKEIVMGKQSNIGPIDPQFGPMAVNGLLQEFKRIRDEIQQNPANALLWEPMLRKLQPGFITECENAISWSRELATRFLKENMFHGVEGAENKIKKIIDHFTEKSTTRFHGRHIGIEEAQKFFGDKVSSLESDQKLQDLILTVHHSTIITLQATNCYKIIENQKGRTFAQLAQQHIQFLQGGPPAEGA